MDVAFERVFSRDNEAFGYFFSGSTLSDLQSFFLVPNPQRGTIGNNFYVQRHFSKSKIPRINLLGLNFPHCAHGAKTVQLQGLKT